jgi:hypothetical protein
MATAQTTGGGNWSGAIWSGGSGAGGAPGDGDNVTINTGHSVLMDTDLSAFTGLNVVTIAGIASGTPGMLYFKTGTNGYLKIRAGGYITGSAFAVKGRLLANNSGTWGDSTPLAYTSKAVFDLTTTGFISCSNLNVALYDSEPTNTYVRTYYDKYAVSSVSVANNNITMASAPGWAANRAVCIRVVGAGTLPSPLQPNQIYYVTNPSGSTLQLAYLSGGTLVTLADTGTGSFEIYSGYAAGLFSGVTQVNVLEDITSDNWSTVANHNAIYLVNYIPGSSSADVQILTLATINSASLITLSAALDSAQYPGARVYIVSRNISIRTACTTTVTLIANGLAGGVFNCELRNTTGSIAGDGYSTLLNCTIGGTVFGILYELDYCYNCTITAILMNGSYATRYAANCNISGDIVGNTNGLYLSRNNVVSSTFFGVSWGLFVSGNNTFSGIFLGCGYPIFGSSGYNRYTGAFRSCYWVNLYSYEELFDGATFDGNTQIGYLYGCRIHFRNTIHRPPNELAVSARNATYADGRLTFENMYLGTVQEIYDNFGTLYKTACNGSGDSPSQDPNGGSDYCIEASSIQSNCGSMPTLGTKSSLKIIDKQRIWLAAGAHTLTYKVQTTFGSGITAGNLLLSCEYIGTSGILTTVTNAPAISLRSNAADWSQTLAVTFTSSADGWVTVSLELMQYASGKEVYTWPTPVFS